jgi:hypothetical protein
MKKKNRAILFLIISITLLQIFVLIFSLSSWNTGLAFAVVWIALLIIFIWSSYVMFIDFKFESGYFKFIFFVLIWYEIIIVIRGWSFSSSELTVYLRENIIFWPFLIPFFVFFDKQFSSLKFLMNCFFSLGVIFMVLILVFPSLLLYRISAETVINAFVPGCGFLLLNARYFSNNKTNFSFIVVAIAVLSVTYLARRSCLSVLVEFLCAGYFLNIKSKSPALLFRLLPLFVVGASLLIFYFSSLPMTNKMNERITEDSRSGLYPDFLKEMNNYEYFGKGLNGKYYHPMTDYEYSDEQDSGVVFNAETYRNNAENGYLQLMLSGGFVHIILFVLVLLPAAYNGIFKSSNQLSKACGFVVLFQLINMLVVSTPSLSILYILVWISVGICYKKSIRNKSDEEIRNEFHYLHDSRLKFQSSRFLLSKL